MASQKGRQAWVNLSYTRYKDGKPVKRACDVMKEFMESFTYSDCATGSMDTMSIVLNNSDSRFNKGWMPHKKDSMSAFIVTDNWKNRSKEKMCCGTFIIDQLRFSGPPGICEVGAICAVSYTHLRAHETS